MSMQKTGNASSIENAASKVPAVTLLFWILKIAATMLGETGGDAVTMSLGLGYLVGSLIFVALFAVMVLAQLSARAFHPWLYWATIVATTTRSAVTRHRRSCSPSWSHACSSFDKSRRRRPQPKTATGQTGGFCVSSTTLQFCGSAPDHDLGRERKRERGFRRRCTTNRSAINR
jgi:hypothetical protein